MWELLAMLLCLILVGDVKGDCTELQACEDAIPRTIRNFGFTNLLRINYENLYPFCTTLVDEHLNCMVERVTDICGANTRPFAANYFEIFLTNELSEYCSQNAIQNRRMPALTTLSNQHALDSKLRRRISSSL
ncbi:hypothetical protein PoB_005755200 [Plakobranchus ocellatus]|uniref:Uncharacterized protein n=1 Tax=Plakobranchus ocellatus TaxID=259542 RepID=A0AAV4CHG7_9GAST|nr:hypothetical protein PoB_005755200 [Plakobranchus ocellatus]